MNSSPMLSPWRLALGSAFAVFFLLVLASENLPQSETKTNLDWIDSATLASGFEQGWGVFAPIPASLEVRTFAIVTLPGGEELLWEPPKGNILTGSARFERWRKWSTNIRTLRNESLWETNAWRISQDVEESLGIRPTLVRLYRRWAEAPAPGEGFDRTYDEFMFYAYDPVTESGEVIPLGSDSDENDNDEVVVEENNQPVPTEPAPDPGVAAPQGELPNPDEDPSVLPTPVPRDPGESTTVQQDPIDFSEEQPTYLLFADVQPADLEPTLGDETPAQGNEDQ